MSGWQDEQSVAMSLASVIAIGCIWWLFTPWGQKVLVEQEPPANIFPDLAPAPAAAAAPGGKKKKR